MRSLNILKLLARNVFINRGHYAKFAAVNTCNVCCGIMAIAASLAFVRYCSEAGHENFIRNVTAYAPANAVTNGEAETFGGFLWVILFFIGAICFLSVLSQVMLNLGQRRGEIAAYFSYGFTKRQIIAEFAAENFIIISISAVLGCAAAYAIVNRIGLSNYIRPEANIYIAALMIFGAACAFFISFAYEMKKQ